jgi:hypothetical protein
LRRTQAATVVMVSLVLPVTLAAPAEAALHLHLSNSAPSKLALRSVPHAYLSWYRQAARTCQGLPWPVLAGIGEMESDHGQSTAPGVHSAANFAGAEGPMQFEPGTFTAFAVHADRSRSLSPYDPKDAIFTAARMLCDEGARGGSPTGITSALFAYNHADWYPPEVMGWAAKYTTNDVAHRVLVTRIVHRRVAGVRLRPHHVVARPAVTAPHTGTAPHATGTRRHAVVASTPEPPQSTNPLASIPVPASPTPTPSATQPATAQPAPTQPAPTQPATAQTAAPQVSADAQQLATESQQLSAEAEQLSDEAQQLAEEAQQLSAENGPAQPAPAQEVPTQTVPTREVPTQEAPAQAPAQAAPTPPAPGGPEEDSTAP